MIIIPIYLYVRKSPDDKESTETSIKNQIELGKTTCKDKSTEEVIWKIERIFIDRNVSGGDRFRKGFTELYNVSIENASRNPIILSKNQDRFARDPSFFLDTLKDLEVRGVRVYSIMKGAFLSSEDLGDSIMSVVSGQYIIEQRKKARILQQQKIDQGLPSISPPFGYKYNKKKNWVIEGKKANKVRSVHSDREKDINFKITMKEQKINKSLYYRILRNIEKGIYSGWIIYNKKYKDSNKKVIRTEQIKYKGNYEPIIPSNAT